MKKQTHPQKIKTKLQVKDGGVYFKKWLYFRKDLILDIDYTLHLRWFNLEILNPLNNKK